MANLQTNLSWSDFDSETITVTRNATSDTPGIHTVTTIYSGAADFETATGTMYMNPAGIVDQADGVAVITPASDGSLPDVHVGDTMTQGPDAFNVVQVSLWTFAPKHLELTVKRGPVAVKQSVM